MPLILSANETQSSAWSTTETQPTSPPGHSPATSNATTNRNQNRNWGSKLQAKKIWQFILAKCLWCVKKRIRYHRANSPHQSDNLDLRAQVGVRFRSMISTQLTTVLRPKMTSRSFNGRQEITKPTGWQEWKQFTVSTIYSFFSKVRVCYQKFFKLTLQSCRMNFIQNSSAASIR